MAREPYLIVVVDHMETRAVKPLPIRPSRAARELLASGVPLTVVHRWVQARRELSTHLKRRVAANRN